MARSVNEPGAMRKPRQRGKNAVYWPLMLPAIVTPVPGPRSRALAARLRKTECRNVTFISEEFPVFWERAAGTNVWDVDGNRYLDLTSGFAVAGLGYGPPEIVAAMRAQAGQLYHAMGDVHPTELKVRLCEELSALTFERWGLGNGKTILANSGSEAVEAALKTAFLTTGKRGVIAFEGAYHGLGYGALETAGLPFFREPFRGQLGDFATLVPYPEAESELEEIERQLARLLTKGEIGCILVEPCQGRAGDIVPPAGFASLLRKLCDQQGTLLIFDEIYTGFNRTGRLFACDHSPAKPDLICLGKGLTSGFPLSACVGRAEVMDAWPETSGEALHTSTFLGNPLGCRMALESLRLQKDAALAGRVRQTGGKLRAALEGIAHPRRGRVRGVGLMLGMEILDAAGQPDPALPGEIITRGLRDGLILLGGGKTGNVLSFTPPFAISEEEIAFVSERLKTYFAERSRKAFTLIELLVVLTIIAILAAIALPVLGRTQAVAQSAKCQANLRQIGAGLTLCTNDNNNILPNSAYGNGGAASNNGSIYKWMDAIFPYAPNESVFRCPSDAGAKYTYAGKLAGGATSTDYGSYGLNGAYSAAGDGQTPPRSSSAYQVNRLQIEEPATTVWVADTNNRQEGNGSFGFTWTNAGANPSITKTTPRQLEKIIERHRDATNVLFCDGHVEARKLERLTTTHPVVDPVDGSSKNVMPIFTIEAD